jgi:hypothetical protein
MHRDNPSPGIITSPPAGSKSSVHLSPSSLGRGSFLVVARRENRVSGSYGFHNVAPLFFISDMKHTTIDWTPVTGVSNDPFVLIEGLPRWQ